MTSPFIFIGTYQLQPGKAEDLKTYWKEFWSTSSPVDVPTVCSSATMATVPCVVTHGSRVSPVRTHR